MAKLLFSLILSFICLSFLVNVNANISYLDRFMQSISEGRNTKNQNLPHSNSFTNSNSNPRGLTFPLATSSNANTSDTRGLKFTESSSQSQNSNSGENRTRNVSELIEAMRHRPNETDDNRSDEFDSSHQNSSENDSLPNEDSSRILSEVDVETVAVNTMQDNYERLHQNCSNSSRNSSNESQRHHHHNCSNGSENGSNETHHHHHHNCSGNGSNESYYPDHHHRHHRCHHNSSNVSNASENYSNETHHKRENCGRHGGRFEDRFGRHQRHKNRRDNMLPNFEEPRVNNVYSEQQIDLKSISSVINNARFQQEIPSAPGLRRFLVND